MLLAQRALAFVGAAALLCAQNPATYEVAAIKPGEIGAIVGSGVSLRPTGEARYLNLTLGSILVSAYGVKPYQIVGGPDWVRKERFTITAKAYEHGPMKPADHYPLVQALLAERFHLKIRRATAELSAYALMVDKSGPKMQVSAPGEKTSESSGSASGGFGGANAGSEMRWTATTMDMFLTRLAFFMKNRDTTPLLNRTELTGSYNFALPYTRETSNNPDAPSIFSVIKDLGLKLEKGKFPVETIVIETIERPTFD